MAVSDYKIIKEQAAKARAREAELTAAFAEALHDILPGDMSVAEFSFLTGIAGPEVSKYRNGQRSPSIGRAALFAEVLGVPLDALLPKRAATPPSAAPGGLPLDELVAPPHPRRGRGTSGL